MRWSFGIVLVCLALGLAACSNPLDKEPSSAQIPTGCGQCEEEIADLVATLEETPGVETVTSTRRTTTGVPQAHLRVGVQLTGTDVVSTDVGTVVDAVAEAAWRSEVSPLDVLSVDVSLSNGYTEEDGFFFGADRQDYEERWGERPEGSAWTPVDDDESGAADGCARDSCPDLVREIARDVSALPGVVGVTRSDYVTGSPTNGSSVDLTLTTDGGDVTEQVAEVVWRSTVEPLEWIDVTAQGPTGTPRTVRFWIDPANGQDHDRLEQKWGPRPVGD